MFPSVPVAASACCCDSRARRGRLAPRTIDLPLSPNTTLPLLTSSPGRLAALIVDFMPTPTIAAPAATVCQPPSEPTADFQPLPASRLLAGRVDRAARLVGGLVDLRDRVALRVHRVFERRLTGGAQRDDDVEGCSSTCV
jgi:hypothetical protein